MKTDPVLLEQRGFVSLVTLNRPDNRNSMTSELLNGFQDIVKKLKDNNDARAVVITGNGHCFSAGADFRSQVQIADDMSLPHEKSYNIYKPFLSVLDIEVPVIAAMNGHAVGGGFGLAMACDLRLVHASSKYGANFCKLGISPGMGLSYSLPAHVGHAKASELFYTGKLFSGHEAYLWGLALSVHENDVLSHALNLAASIAQNAPLALKTTKKLLQPFHRDSLISAAKKEAVYQAEILNTPDAIEGMQALLEKREPHFNGKPN